MTILEQHFMETTPRLLKNILIELEKKNELLEAIDAKLEALISKEGEG